MLLKVFLRHKQASSLLRLAAVASSSSRYFSFSRVVPKNKNDDHDDHHQKQMTQAFSFQDKCSSSQEHSQEVRMLYEKVSEETLESLTEFFEQLGEEQSDDYDVSYSSGVLNVKLGAQLGTYVLNKQTPNLQIWLSSPVSGPKRFDYLDATWVYKRTGEVLHELLSRELSQLFGKQVNFSSCAHGKKK